MVQKQNQNQKAIHEGLNRQHKNAITILAMLVLSEFLFDGFVAGAGELTANNLLDCTNAIRAEHGAPPVYLNEKLNLASYNKLADMARYGYWAHQNPVSGKYPWDFVDEVGYYYQASAENLAFGFSDSEAVCDSWRSSKTHLENIINPDYLEIGFAIDKANLHKNGTGLLVVQIFGSRADFTLPEDDLAAEKFVPDNFLRGSSGDTKINASESPLNTQEKTQSNMILGLQKQKEASSDFVRPIYLISILAAFIVGRKMIPFLVKKFESEDNNVHRNISAVLAIICALGAILIIFIP